MDKMNMETANKTLENLAKLKEMFPEVITESKDENGEIVAAVDAKKLEQLLSTKVIEGDECYDFTWVGKKQAMVEACKPIRKTLRPCREESVDWENTQNLYIEGDNLDVLKLLQESYLNKVKMIYIDPPYNTGNDSFIYPDDYSTNKELYDEEVGAIDESGYRMFKNTETNGRFHSSWCSMMYPRLKLARNLLSEDGVIFISIDDNEVDNMRKMCDEVFGASNFIANFIWQKKTQPSFLSREVANITEYLLTYKKNANIVPLKGGFIDNERDGELINIGNPVVERILPCSALEIERGKFTGVLNPGIYGNGVLEVEILNRVEVINGIPNEDIHLRGRITRSQETLNKDIQNGAKLFIRNTKTMRPTINLNRQEIGIKPPVSLFSKKLDENIPTNTDASNEMKDMFNGINIASYPKPTKLIKYIIDAVTYENKSSIILDFFSGSATTAHAVMQLNAEDGGNRKFIMVQLPEICDEKSEAYKAGYKNICEIGKERIRRAGKKIVEETGKTDLDIGFRVLKLDSSNMKDVYYAPADYKQTMLEKMTSNIEEGRTAEDLLYACMLEWGLELSLPHKVQKIAGFDVHIVNNGDLVACFADKISEEAIKQIAEMKPLRAVFRDSSFATDAARVNVGEIFKLKSPNTTIKVL